MNTDKTRTENVDPVCGMIVKLTLGTVTVF